jgi:hypothetical protein
MGLHGHDSMRALIDTLLEHCTLFYNTTEYFTSNLRYFLRNSLIKSIYIATPDMLEGDMAKISPIWRLLLFEGRMLSEASSPLGTAYRTVLKHQHGRAAFRGASAVGVCA